MCTVTHPAKQKEASVSEMTIASEAVEVEEMTAEQGQQMLERASAEKFKMTWSEFYGEYQRGGFVGTPRARDAEELAFLAPFAR